MQLSLRLSAIAEMVTKGNRVVDVGCDHGYLPIYLVQNQWIPSAIAMDVRRGPLSRAQEHISQYHLENYITTRLSDGLARLQQGEGDTLIIAGMGGPLMEKILTEGAEVLESFRELILQPQSDVPHFRRFLAENGWKTVREGMVLEDGKFYPMMKAVLCEKGEMPAYTEEDFLFGKELLEQKNPVLHQYLERELRIREDILGNLSKVSGAATQNRQKEVEEEKRLIQAAMKGYESL